MLKLPRTLTVRYRGTDVGILAMTPDNRRCAFEYDRRWLAEGFSISPLELPLKSGMQLARTDAFYGNFGIFEDSMPDGYGNYLLERILRKYGTSLSEMTPVERLSLIGDKGMGALCYVPGMELNTRADSTTLDRMQQDALDVLSERDFTRTETLYVNSGNSGGCRPKCLWNDDDGRWIVKFRHTYDPEDAGKREYDILMLARECGITVPRMKLFNDRYLGTERFDVSPAGDRLHVGTACGLLCEPIREPMLDYRRLLRFTAFLTRDISQSKEMFRRMLFNYMIGNNDDHSKNFSFICSEGQWSCSPAYDITECPTANNGCHATMFNGKEKPGMDDFIIMAADAGMTRNEAVETIREMKGKIENHRSARVQYAKASLTIPVKKAGRR